jgi:sulfur-carrier protein
VTAIRVELPASLCALARIERDIVVHVAEAPTQRTLLDALEAALPALRGTIRDQATQRRRPFIRFFAAGADLSHDAPDTPLPAKVIAGDAAFLVVGAIAGG